MFVATNYKCVPGEIKLGFHPLACYKTEIIQKHEIVREASREEFISYWEREEPELYRKSVEEFGVPDTQNYYEIKVYEDSEKY